MATEIRLPEVGEGIDGGTVIALLVGVGDRVKVDQPVLELETDKAVIEVPSSVAGLVEDVHVEVNQEARVGQVILTLADDLGEVPAAQADEVVQGETTIEVALRKEGVDPSPAATQTRSGSLAAEASGRQKLIPAAPSVRRLAREMGVDIHEVAGSGILDRISAQDVVRYADHGGVAPVGPVPAHLPAPALRLPDFSRWGEIERVPMSGIRKAMLRTMTTAWSNVPMVTHFDKADITSFELFRKRHRSRAEAVGTKLTPTAMIIKIVATALRRFPEFNASIDVAADEVVYKRYVNIGVAVDTEHGLLVPVIKQADKKNVIELALELGGLAEKARTRKLTPDEMQGGNFSVSNLGGIGGTGFTPIVTPPDIAILGVSRGEFEPVYDQEAEEFTPRLVMPLSLSYDHRLIDGAGAARFLRWICQAIEEPFLMVLEG